MVLAPQERESSSHAEGKHPQTGSCCLPLPLQGRGRAHPGGAAGAFLSGAGWQQRRLAGSELRKGIREVFLNTCDFKPRPHSRQQRLEVGARLRPADCPGGAGTGGASEGADSDPGRRSAVPGPWEGAAVLDPWTFWVTSSEWLHLSVPLLPSCVCLA